MSADLWLDGCAVRPTSSAFAERMRGERDRWAIFRAYCAEAIDPLRPAPLRGKDARNPHLVARDREENARLDAEALRLDAYLREHPQARWRVD